ncbi:MAG: FAD binding domain-containing protein [Thermomicrobiales bacterium]
MFPAPFEYHRAESVQGAIGLLQELGDEAKLIAGGHSLLPIMKLRLAQPGHLIDLGWIDALHGINAKGSLIRIGALTTHRQIASDPTLQTQCPILAEVAATIGDVQVRNRGTIGGALAHADAAADYPAAMLALDAEIVAQGPNSERTIPASDFFVGFLTTALEPNELLTEVRVQPQPSKTGASYQKLANQASGYALAGVAAIIAIGDDGRVSQARIGITGAADTAARASGVEQALAGSSLDDAAIRAAAERAGDGIDFLDDIHASADYRRAVTIGLTRRAIQTAAARARESK